MTAEQSRSPQRIDGPVRVALIGAGSMANSVHYPSLAELPDVELVGLCDLVPEKLAKTAERFGVARTFASYREMIDATKPHAVYALMPPHHLYDVAMDVLERGCHLFVEKPPALTAFQSECLARRAEEKGLITGVGFQRRYHPLFQRCADEVGRAGRPHLVISSFVKNQPPSAVHPYYRGAVDILTSDAIHAVDSMRFYAGGEVAEVAADVRTLDAWYATSWNALVRFDNGCTGIFVANWRCGSRRLRLELHSLGCSAYADADGTAEVYRENKKEPALTMSHTEVAGSEETRHHQGFFQQAKAFIEAVRTGTPLHNTLADSVKTMRLVEQILYRATGQGA